MINHKTGFWASVGAATFTFIFGISMFFDTEMFSYLISIFISFSFIMLASAFESISDNKVKVFANTGLSFAIVYAVYINMVYFSQLTVVRLMAESSDVINALKYQPGSWMFMIDLIGYGFLALSTFFLGLTLKPERRSDKWLKVLLMVHGIFAITSFILPAIDMAGMSESPSGAMDFGILALLFWCVIFIPIMALSASFFRYQKTWKTQK